ncbi:MAG: ABC transporter permease, partial [Thermoanaerobaculia bacterium]
PLPYPEPDRLVRVFESSTTYPQFPISPANFLDHRQAMGGTGELAIYMRNDVELTSGDQSERLLGMQVSADFFRVLGIGPLFGRDVERGDEVPESEQVVLISHRLWQRLYDGRAEVLGRRIVLDGVGHTVVGVLPAGVQHVGGSYRSAPHGTVVDVWRPMAFDPETARRWAHYLNAIARLDPGVSVEQADAVMNATHRRLAVEYPDVVEGWRITVVALVDDIVGGTRHQLLVLLGAVSLVLLIACVNVANLLLTRAIARRQEIGVRRALGAGNARLARQLLTESLILAAAGGAFGLALAFGGVEALRALAPDRLPRLHEVGIDLRVLGFTTAVTLLTGLLFGCVPAFHAARTSLRETLQSAGGAVVGQRSALRRFLVVAELALAIVLLVGAGLLLGSFVELRRVDAGFETEQVLTASVALPAARYSEDQQVAAFFPRLLERIEALPGVVSAGAGSDLPWTGYDENLGMRPEDRLGDEDAAFRTRFHMVTPGYFKSLGVPILAGREVDASDDRTAPQRVVINARLAARAWPGGGAVGRRLSWSSEPDEDDFHTVVGVVGDVKDAPGDADLLPAVYFPHAQQTWRNQLQLVIRTTIDPRAVAAAVRRELRELDADLPLADVRTLTSITDESYAEPRFLSWLLGSFAAVALVLALVGLYGVMSYSVGLRRREMALRMALGAGARNLIGLVLAQGMRLVATGITIGVLAALAFSRVLEGLLYGVAPNDPATIVAVVVLLAAVALIANLLPARRAARVDPVVALRHE